jgi:hypothetical protein
VERVVRVRDGSRVAPTVGGVKEGLPAPLPVPPQASQLVFFGAWDPAGDFRDWPEIDAYAAAIAAQIKAGQESHQ